MTLQGLLIFDPEEGDRAHGRDSQTGQLAVPRWNLALVRSDAVDSLGVPAAAAMLVKRSQLRSTPSLMCAQLPRKEVASGLVTAMGLLWAVSRVPSYTL